MSLHTNYYFACVRVVTYTRGGVILLFRVFFLLLGGQESASGVDVLASRRTDGGEKSTAVEVVAEVLESALVGGAEGGVGDGVETDEIDAAVEGSQQAHEGVGMAVAVVEAVEDDVLEGQAALLGALFVIVVGLAAEVVLAEYADNVFDAESALGGHDLGALGGEGMMEGDGEIAVALVEEAHKAFGQTDTADSDATRTPAVAPLFGQGQGSFQDSIKIVKRFTLPHKHDVRQPIALREGIYLIENVCRAEVCSKSLTARHAELAMHLAAYLTAHTECCTTRSLVCSDAIVAKIRDIDGFDEVSRGGAIEVFNGTITALHLINRGADTNLVLLGYTCSCHLGEIGHLVDGRDMLLVDPPTYLLSNKFGETQF